MRALVVRFEEEGRRRVQEFLEGHGYAVSAFGTGADGLKSLQGDRPDLIVADAVLPKLSGFELCRELRESSGKDRVPFVLILEENDAYGRGRARAEGVDLVLSEPVLEDDLMDLLNVKAGDGEAIEGVLSDGSGTRDRFLKEILRGGNKSDPITTRISDPLTGLHNKAFISLKLEEEFKKAKRYGNPLAMLLVEVENFEDVRHTHGKQASNEVLLEVAGIILCESRDVDAGGRVEEARFLLLLPSTDLPGAKIMADRVFQEVCSRTIYNEGNEIPIRASVGIVALPSDDIATVDDFAERALRAMRTATNMGGNRICAWGDAERVIK